MSFGLGFSGSSQSARNTTRDITPIEFKRLRGPAAALFKNLSENPPGFEGPFTAGLSDTEQRLLGQFTNSNPSPLGGQVNDFFGSTLRGDFLRPESNPFLQGVLDLGLRNLGEQRDQLRRDETGIFSRAGQRTQDSSPFAFAEALSNRASANAGSDFVTNVLSQNFQAERDRQVQVSQQAQSFLGERFDRAKQQLEAAALPRLIEQFGIDQGVKEFERRMNFTRDLLQILAQVTSPTPGSFGSSSGSSFGVNVSGGVG